jgi:hypothetical protein
MTPMSIRASRIFFKYDSKITKKGHNGNKRVTMREEDKSAPLRPSCAGQAGAQDKQEKVKKPEKIRYNKTDSKTSLDKVSQKRRRGRFFS